MCFVWGNFWEKSGNFIWSKMQRSGCYWRLVIDCITDAERSALAISFSRNNSKRRSLPLRLPKSLRICLPSLEECAPNFQKWGLCSLRTGHLQRWHLSFGIFSPYLNDTHHTAFKGQAETFLLSFNWRAFSFLIWVSELFLKKWFLMSFFIIDPRFYNW